MRKIWWTWDIRTRWSHGFCYSAKSFVDNYTAMVDSARDFGVEGIVVWGFLRDRHGGVDAAKQLVDYAGERGVDIYPGVGIDDYGGVYYDGKSPYALDSYLREHPEARALRQDGTPDFHLWPPTDQTPRLKACPSNERILAYYRESIDWLVDSFKLKGFQIEQGDSGLCWCPTCAKKPRVSSPDCAHADVTAASRRIPAVVDQLLKRRPDMTIITETYAGLTAESLRRMEAPLRSYQPQIIISWQVYDGNNNPERDTPTFKIDDGIKSPTPLGNAAIRTNNDLFLGEADERQNIRKALELSKQAGLTMTYLYGEYPSSWPVTRRNYECWAANA